MGDLYSEIERSQDNDHGQEIHAQPPVPASDPSPECCPGEIEGESTALLRLQTSWIKMPRPRLNSVESPTKRHQPPSPADISLAMSESLLKANALLRKFDEVHVESKEREQLRRQLNERRTAYNRTALSERGSPVYKSRERYLQGSISTMKAQSDTIAILRQSLAEKLKMEEEVISKDLAKRDASTSPIEENSEMHQQLDSAIEGLRELRSEASRIRNRLYKIRKYSGIDLSKKIINHPMTTLLNAPLTA